jgi:hypothetical protein
MNNYQYYQFIQEEPGLLLHGNSKRYPPVSSFMQAEQRRDMITHIGLEQWNLKTEEQQAHTWKIWQQTHRKL